MQNQTHLPHPDDETIVRSLLAAHHISPTEEEIGHMVAAYPANRVAVDELYTLSGVRYEEPAVTFDPRI
ncbi:hypothetical protein [Citricoccus sp. GCM10030269]|uniref:hypothetical protein n=1 Tax=Citricoccus sp. GCM10030269 TaxID=3273388 RepID=UPI003608BD5E